MEWVLVLHLFACCLSTGFNGFSTFYTEANRKLLAFFVCGEEDVSCMRRSFMIYATMVALQS